MLILLYFCNRDIYTENMKKIWYCLFEEFLLRNMTKIFVGKEMKEILNKIIKEMVVENNIEIKKERILSIFREKYENKYFVENLKKVHVYNKVYDEICSDVTLLSKYHWTKIYAKLKIDKKINENFKKVYYEEISKYTQKKIYNIIFNDSDFLISFEFKGRDK